MEWDWFVSFMEYDLGYIDCPDIENMERETGLEPATSSLGSWHSTTELLPLSTLYKHHWLQWLH